jgi:phosphate starvation-inducible membrane PsiE
MSERIVKFYAGARRQADTFGGMLVEAFHLLALFAIGAATVWSAVFAFLGMVDQGQATIKDILLLFIYLELGAMVGIYFHTRRLPVRYLLYVAITALTRLMIDIVSVEHKQTIEIVIIAGAILLISIAVVILRFGSFKYPSNAVDENTDITGSGAQRGRAAR